MAPFGCFGSQNDCDSNLMLLALVPSLDGHLVRRGLCGPELQTLHELKM